MKTGLFFVCTPCRSKKVIQNNVLRIWNLLIQFVVFDSYVKTEIRWTVLQLKKCARIEIEKTNTEQKQLNSIKRIISQKTCYVADKKSPLVDASVTYLLNIHVYITLPWIRQQNNIPMSYKNRATCWFALTLWCRTGLESPTMYNVIPMGKQCKYRHQSVLNNE